MESEKVKEIKKGLKFMMGLVLSNKLPYIDGNTPKQIAYEEIFNYINELEKENAELKVDLKNSIDMQKQMLDGFKTATKEVELNLARELPNLLKQFAERLKEKLEECSPFVGFDLEDLEFDGETIQGCIDETLKEFMK